MMKVALTKGQGAATHWLRYCIGMLHFHDTKKVFVIGDDVMLADGLLRSEANQNSSWMQNNHSGNKDNLSVASFVHVGVMWRLVYRSDQWEKRKLRK